MGRGSEPRAARAPRAQREALHTEAVRHLAELTRQREVGAVHHPISPAFEQAMMSAIAQGHVELQGRSYWMVGEREQRLTAALLAHQHLSQGTIRWVTLQAHLMWRPESGEAVGAHPACTVIEAATLPQGGWYGARQSGFVTAAQERWPTWQAWRSAAQLWGTSGALHRRAFYRFADEVTAGPGEVQEVFERLCADAPGPERGEGTRRRVWELYRIAQHV